MGLKHDHAKEGGHTAVYRAWQAMLNRCRYPKVHNYARYGGRGIKVCERWRKFKNFYADMGERPSPTHTIDRVNNDGDYEPGNCRWATKVEQARNSRAQKLSEEALRRIRDLHSAGVGWPQIAREVGVTRQWVGQIIRQGR